MITSAWYSFRWCDLSLFNQCTIEHSLGRNVIHSNVFYSMSLELGVSGFYNSFAKLVFLTHFFFYMLNRVQRYGENFLLAKSFLLNYGKNSVI